MIKIAHILGGKVVNTSIAESEAHAHGGIPCPEDTGIGDLHDGTAFHKPPAAEKTPEQLEAEAKAALRENDIRSIRAIREYIAARPDAPPVLVEREAEAVQLRDVLVRNRQP